MIEEKLAKMSIAEKVGQMFQLGFDGLEPSADVKEMITNYHVGGIIYFRRNIESLEQVASLSKEIQQSARESGNVPLIISADQEGGTVTRLKGGTHFPGNMALGATHDPELARFVGEVMGKELKAVGINMNLAPVLDINNNPVNPVIGVRSYGSDPELVARMGTAYAKGLQEAGVIATGKHFPGHGDTATDSHLALPVIGYERNRLEKVELYPFKEAISAGIDSIMTAHIYFSTIEPEEGKPATLSHAVLTDLLRKEMDFAGLIITDCMEMNAIVSTYGTVEGALMTIEAGADMVLISHTRDKQIAAIEAVIAAVNEGRISEQRIDESVRRILKLKAERIGLEGIPEIDVKKVDLKKSYQVASQVGEQSVTMVCDHKKLIPFPDKSKTAVIDFVMDRVALVENQGERDNQLVKMLKSDGIEVDHISLQEGDIELPKLDTFDRVVVCTYNAAGSPYQVEVINKLFKRDLPLVVVSLRNPYDLLALPDISTYLTTYDYSPFNLRALSAVLAGKKEARGILPVELKRS